MTLSEFHSEIDKILELPDGTITGSESLSSLSAWDSLAVLSFIAMVDEKFKMQLAARDISQCNTVGELAALLGPKIS